MASVTIAIRANMSNLFAELAARSQHWTDQQVQEFWQEWENLRSAGAETVETAYHNGTITAYPSEDLTRHCEKWGVCPGG